MMGETVRIYGMSHTAPTHGAILTYDGRNPLCMTDIWFTHDSHMTPMWPLMGHTHGAHAQFQ